jgi:hypothetical protein
MAGLRRFLRKTLLATWLSVRGRRALKRGDVGLAKKLLDKVVEISPGHFTAHLLLGYAALFDGRVTESIREFGICYRLNGRRFEGSRIPASVKEKVLMREEGFGVASFDFDDSDSFDDPDERILDALGSAGTDLLDEDPAAAGTDFSSRDEYLKFKNLPPITDEERQRIDWDTILRKLQENR